ncbi:amidase family protein [Rugamonas sp. CCM 8940]|uniref:amidase family protein n=1 Tax=Rugamonas sp. CCM 8940 TaxID=2765359 RepID=UPI001EEEC706|nr:amidase family protein [Rugamonas sp. CCM 8940]
MGLSAGTTAQSDRAQGAASLPRITPKLGASPILDAGVQEQQELMQAGKLTSHWLTSQYLARIKTIDGSGTRRQSLIEVNPEALKIALEMDRERALKRLRGPLHGIPVLLKDNIATADRMSTASGERAASDAHVAAQLRAAGAVIIGKTSRSEWRDTQSGELLPGRGMAADGGYLPERRRSGAGAAIAAGLATLAVGTETDGACVAPASFCGLVGIKPTLGLVSRGGIVALALRQDAPGPLARSVADAALMLAVMAGVDSADPATQASVGRVVDYSAALNKGGLGERRIGVVRDFFGRSEELDLVIADALQALLLQGAQLVDVHLGQGGQAGALPPGALDALMAQQRLDALVAPSCAPAELAEYPHVTVPAGQVCGRPVGLSFVGTAYSEAALIQMAYAFEQATLHWRAPKYPASVLLNMK